MSPIRICSWNINGLRSIQQPLKCVLDSLSSDIICLQETKSTPDISSEFVLSDNYNAYFSHSLHKPGYSGVAIFCRNPIKPVKTYHSLNEMIIEITSPGSDGCELTNGWDFLMRELNISHTEARNLDAEGRILALQFPADIFDVVGSDSKRCLPLVVMSIYFPRLNSEDVNRLNFKHNFQHAVKLCTELFLLENFVVMAGDFNICHKVIDHCAPDEFEAEKISNPFRQWFDQLLVEQQRDQSLNTEEYSQSRRFVDIFRLLHPNQKNAFTCWSSRTNARQTNYGVRLDYILVDSQLANLYALPNDEIKADLMPDICGSDHCPIYADLPYSYNSNAKLSYSFPPKCSHHWPQCQTKQTQIKNF
uniref:exodeoxyribonuclease III n=1 Tax=Trichobilharzia regenti TaxID=157069 RepID=A0AA85KFX0_TRIRE|nr:unnamed protein product [Trichobilharzia regenti]